MAWQFWILIQAKTFSSCWNTSQLWNGLKLATIQLPDALASQRMQHCCNSHKAHWNFTILTEFKIPAGDRSQVKSALRLWGILKLLSHFLTCLASPPNPLSLVFSASLLRNPELCNVFVALACVSNTWQCGWSPFPARALSHLSGK